MRYRVRRRYRFRRGGRRRLAILVAVIVAISAAAVFLIYFFSHRDRFSCQGFGASPSAQTTPVADFVSDIGQSAPSSASAMPAITPPVQGGTEGMAFVGNSGIDDLYVSGFIPDAAYYYKVGLNVKDAFEKTMDMGTVPVIEELKGHDYNEVFLLFGQNELGWPAEEVFFEEYARLIQKVHEYCPNATVYVMSILPMSKEASDRNENGENQPRADEYNTKLQEMARENGAVFLDFTTDLKDETGYLPADASADGVHLNQEHLGIWADMIKNRASYAQPVD